MTNKEKWLYAILGALSMLATVLLFWVLGHNFPRFADAMERMYGGTIPDEYLFERLVAFSVPLTITWRVMIEVIDALCDEDDCNRHK